MISVNPPLYRHRGGPPCRTQHRSLVTDPRHDMVAVYVIMNVEFMTIFVSIKFIYDAQSLPNGNSREIGNYNQFSYYDLWRDCGLLVARATGGQISGEIMTRVKGLSKNKYKSTHKRVTEIGRIFMVIDWECAPRPEDSDRALRLHVSGRLLLSRWR